VRIALTAVVLATLLTAASALAARAPTRSERAAITRAVPRGPSVCYPLNIKISTRNARYASAGYRSERPRCRARTGKGVYLLKRASARRWTRLAFGTSFDCRRPLPPAVMRDLLSYCRR
jgi:hypothetical protein